jgi:hypothetical protein
MNKNENKEIPVENKCNQIKEQKRATVFDRKDITSISSMLDDTTTLDVPKPTLLAKARHTRFGHCCWVRAARLAPAPCASTSTNSMATTV